METVDGMPVTDEMIQEWADEVERGYDVDALKERGCRSTRDDAARVISARMDDSLVAAVGRHVEKDGTSRSEIIRSTV